MSPIYMDGNGMGMENMHTTGHYGIEHKYFFYIPWSDIDVGESIKRWYKRGMGDVWETHTHIEL